MLDAVETIIEFKETIGNYSSIIVFIYIKIENHINNTAPQTNYEIMENCNMKKS